jgi:hypothetical protein
VAKPAVHLYRSGIHHLVLDADASQVPMQPKAVAARIVTAHHPGREGILKRSFAFATAQASFARSAAGADT